jgi:DNA replication licensing factor MCM3
MMDDENIPNELESQVMKFMGKSEIMTKIQEMINRNGRRLIINIDTVRQFDANLAAQIISNPMKLIPLFEANLQDQTNEILSSSDKAKTQKNDKTIIGKKQLSYKITFDGTFGRNMVSPRGLTSELTNQYVSVQGIVTRMSIVRPKLVHSVHYAESTKQGSVKEYTDSYGITQSNNNNQIQGRFVDKNYNSNAVPQKDIYGNTLDFEYGLSFFRDFQTLLVQEPPERTPVGQLPRSIEVILQDDLVDKTKPGDRYHIFKFLGYKFLEFSNVFLLKQHPIQDSLEPT